MRGIAKANRGEETHGQDCWDYWIWKYGQSICKTTCLVLNVMFWPTINTKRGFLIRFVQEVQMERMFEEADILSLHIPLTEETKMLVNQDYLKTF